jgi:putative hemolysin
MQTRFVIVFGAMALSACARSLSPWSEFAPTPPPPRFIGLANPASVYCVQQGGAIRMASTPQGQHGDCVLPDGRVIEEWLFFRQNQPTQ